MGLRNLEVLFRIWPGFIGSVNLARGAQIAKCHLQDPYQEVAAAIARAQSFFDALRETGAVSGTFVTDVNEEAPSVIPQNAFPVTLPNLARRMRSSEPLTFVHLRLRHRSYTPDARRFLEQYAADTFRHVGGKVSEIAEGRPQVTFPARSLPTIRNMLVSTRPS